MSCHTLRSQTTSSRWNAIGAVVRQSTAKVRVRNCLVTGNKLGALSFEFTQRKKKSVFLVATHYRKLGYTKKHCY